MNNIVIGCGGIGSWFAQSLAKMAKEPLILCDMDTLERKNLDRQLYDPGFIGWNKAEALSTILKETDTVADITAQSNKVTVQTTLPENSFLFCCVDNNAGRLASLSQCDHDPTKKLIIMANEKLDAEAYYYDASMKGTEKDPRIMYPEMVQPDEPNAAAEQHSCQVQQQQTGQTQSVCGNINAAAMGLRLWYYHIYEYHTVEGEALTMPFIWLHENTANRYKTRIGE